MKRSTPKRRGIVLRFVSYANKQNQNPLTLFIHTVKRAMREEVELNRYIEEQEDWSALEDADLDEPY